VLLHGTPLAARARMTTMSLATVTRCAVAMMVVTTTACSTQKEAAPAGVSAIPRAEEAPLPKTVSPYDALPEGVQARVGDRITIGDDEGDVQSINLRTTVVTTNDRVAIIVPNSKLVSQRVVNWSYGDPRARISIPVSVADDSDTQLVTSTLLDVAKEVENVLGDPPPRVQFLRFGAYSLDFRLLVWTNQPRRNMQIRSDINYRIARLFRERGIKIPYPKQEYLLRNLDLPERPDSEFLSPDSELLRKD